MTNNLIKFNPSSLIKGITSLASNPEARALALGIAPSVITVITTKITESHTTARHCSGHKKELLEKEIDSITDRLNKCDDELVFVDPDSQRYQDLQEARSELMQMLKAAFHDIRYFTDSVVASANPVVYTE